MKHMILGPQLLFRTWLLARCCLAAAHTELNEGSCAANLAEATGELHLLQATAKKVIMIDKRVHSKLHIRQEPGSFGDDACKCIGLVLNGTTNITVENKTVEYPAKAGSSCDAWDAGRYPGCEVGDPPDWCSKKWCYVDPCKCQLEVPPKKTATTFMWQGKPLYWSYATCGDNDTFSESHEQCVSKSKEKDCKGAEGCAWDGARCLGKELVNHCKINEDLKEEVYGKKTCRCIGMAPKDGTVKIEFSKQSGTYPASLGGNCSAWDLGNYPDCKVDDEETEPPEWCKQPWCYVDPCDCDLPSGQPKQTLTTATFQGNPAFWSYGTCGGKDVFTEDASKLPAFPPSFCPVTTTSTTTGVIDLGSADCPCIGIDMAGETPLTFSNTTLLYPSSAGSSCKAWDEGVFPGCDKQSPPSWCSSKWCYVDPCTCNLAVPPKRSTQNYRWQGKVAYWSYATCGGEDAFSDAANPMACVNQENEDLCADVEGCAWDGKKCLGKELVEDCSTSNQPPEDLYGLKTCRCVGWEKDGYVNVTVVGQTVRYPASLGGRCDTWDSAVYPSCKTEIPPEWCKAKWCYVNPCDCTTPDAQPKESKADAMYKGKPVYWSYATCGGVDTFTEEKLPAYPPEFCIDDDSDSGDAKSQAESSSGSGDKKDKKSQASSHPLLALFACLATAVLIRL